MAVFLLDTSVIVDALNGKRGRETRLFDLLAAGHLLASCAVTTAEVYAGMRPSEEHLTSAFLSSLRYYDAPFEVARLAGRFRYDWARKGKTLSLADTLIAATALHYDLTLITDNVRHFPMPQLRLLEA